MTLYSGTLILNHHSGTQWNACSCATKTALYSIQKKFHFAADSVDFAGFKLSPTGIRPTEHMVSAIRDFPIPTNISDAKSWFGLINQVAYVFAASKEMQLFCELLKPDKW